MPPNIITPLTAGSIVTNYPFRLIPTAVKPGNTIASQGDLDCQCPSAITGNTNITSSKLFADLLTDTQKQQIAQQADPKASTKKGVYVARESYLFRGVFPNTRVGIDTSSDLTKLNDYGTFDVDPVIRVYGLDKPIITEDFLAGEDKHSLKTVKIWLTVCFPSGETTAPTFFTPCADKTRNDTKTDVARSDWRSLKPLVAFISYGLQYPKDLVVAKTIDKSLGTQNPPTPRIERRQIEAHVPIGEVNVKGQVVAQYVKTNLMLTALCFNGTPAMYPQPMANNY